MDGISCAATAQRVPCTWQNPPEEVSKCLASPVCLATLLVLFIFTFMSYGHTFDHHPPMKVEPALVFTRQEVKTG